MSLGAKWSGTCVLQLAVHGVPCEAWPLPLTVPFHKRKTAALCCPHTTPWWPRRRLRVQALQVRYGVAGKITRLCDVCIHKKAPWEYLKRWSPIAQRGCTGDT